MGAPLKKEMQSQAAEPLLPLPGVVRLPFLEEDRFWLTASAVDACINLRYPLAGETSGIVVGNPATLVTRGDLTKPAAILAILGFVAIVAFNARRLLGGTLIGILLVTIIGVPLGLAKYSGIVALPPSLAPTLFQFDFSRLFELGFAIVVFSILFVDVFDNAGTLIGVTHRTGR